MDRAIYHGVDCVHIYVVWLKRLEVRWVYKAIEMALSVSGTLPAGLSGSGVLPFRERIAPPSLLHGRSNTRQKVLDFQPVEDHCVNFRARASITTGAGRKKTVAPTSVSTSSDVTLYIDIPDPAFTHLRLQINDNEWRDLSGSIVPSSNGRWARFSVALPSSGGEASTTPHTHRLTFAAHTGPDDSRWVKGPGDADWTVHGVATGARVRADAKGAGLVTQPGILIVSDLDGTMVGDDDATRRFAAWWLQEAIPRGSVLVYSSGRHLELFQTLLEEKRGTLLPPDLYIGSVGTALYRAAGHFPAALTEDADFMTRLDDAWDRELVPKVARRVVDELGPGMPEDARVSMRPAEEQSAHKCTLNVPLASLGDVETSLVKWLKEEGVTPEIISSGCGDWRYLDVVPLAGGKLKSLQYVQRALGFEDNVTLACGDSGNDILMLSGTNRSVIVGNAQAQLREWHEQAPNPVGRRFVAKKACADGILEAIAHAKLL